MEQTLVTRRSYTAFGEVASEMNARGASIDYSYNTLGRLTMTESPSVEITLEDGTASTVRPTEHYYYDVSGRLTGRRDANGNLTQLTLLAGSGYDGAEALVTSQLNADGGERTTRYDIFGDAREVIDERGFRILQNFDGLGRLYLRREFRLTSTSSDNFTDTYIYDGLGQLLRRWNSQLGDTGTNVERSDYDIMGRIVSQAALGGDTTTTAYVWDAGLVTTGLGTFGGWTQTTRFANALESVETSDLFGRAVAGTDMGGHITAYTYDVAGRLATSASGNLTTSFAWLSSGHLGGMTIATPNAGSTQHDWSRDTATYGYDKTGNRLTERLVKESGDYTKWYFEDPDDLGSPFYKETYFDTSLGTVKNAAATYDALGRLKTWSEAGSATAVTPAANVAHHYDANGNIRRTAATYRTLDEHGAVSNTVTRDHWFRYDTMNRVVIDQGTLAGGVIVRGTQVNGAGGREIAWNTGGQRVSVLVTRQHSDAYATWTSDFKELYTYDADGRLTETREAYDASAIIGDPGVTLRSRYTYDNFGRQTRQEDFANGAVVYNRASVYDAAGRLTSDNVVNLKTDGKTHTAATTYSFTSGAGQYLLGAVASSQTVSSVTGTSGSTTSLTTNTYAWHDGAVQSSIRYDADTGSTSNAIYDTSFTYDALGRLTSSYIDDGKPRTVTFLNDELGQAIRRDETRPYNAPSEQDGAPHEVWYRFGGKQMGYTGNNKTSDIAMAASIAERQAPTPTNQGTFRGSSIYGGAYADFAQSYDPLNSYSQGAAGGSYVVRAGDTLAGIAQSLYGDGALWYKIAEANGMAGPAGLTEGRRLILPTGVLRNAHNASTLTPYDPSAVLGDLVPDTNPKPQKKGCGVMGAILLAVVAIAVATLATAGAAALLAGTSFKAALGATIGGSLAGLGAGAGGAGGLGALGAIGVAATGGAIGSMASQGLGVATGIQDKFSWKAVGLTALSAGIGASMGAGGLLGGENGMFAGKIYGFAARGAIGSAGTQGIGRITGLQDTFSWAGVAAAAVGADIAGGVGGMLGESFGAQLATSAASALANAATRSAIEGSNFGRNIVAAIPDVIGQALGRVTAKGIGSLIEGIGRLAVTEPPMRTLRFASNGEVGARLPGGPVRGVDINEASDAEIFGYAKEWEKHFGSPDYNQGYPEFAYEDFMQLYRQRGALEFDQRMAELDPGPLGSATPVDLGGIDMVAHHGAAQAYRSDWLSNGDNAAVSARLNREAVALQAALDAAQTQVTYGVVTALVAPAIVAGSFVAAPTTFGGFALAGGLEGASLGALFRGASGGQNTAGTLLTDTAFGAGGGLVAKPLTSAASLLAAKFARSGNVGSEGLEAVYQARYSAAYKLGVVDVDAKLLRGDIAAPEGQPAHLFRANEIDRFARDDLRLFAAGQGHGSDMVRINQRLYLQGDSGKYRIPDLYFPQSGKIFDGTLALKNARTPQVIDFRTANNNAPVGIIRPQSPGGFYWIGN